MVVLGIRAVLFVFVCVCGMYVYTCVLLLTWQVLCVCMCVVCMCMRVVCMCVLVYLFSIVCLYVCANNYVSLWVVDDLCTHMGVSFVCLFVCFFCWSCLIYGLSFPSVSTRVCVCVIVCIVMSEVGLPLLIVWFLFTPVCADLVCYWIKMSAAISVKAGS